jgi:uncharacterized protein (DUF2147 family)
MSILLVLAAAATTTFNPIVGRWHTPEDRAIVEIAPCGNQLCGTIIGAVPLPNTNTPPRDTHNPDPALRNRSIVGVRLLAGFVQGRGKWTGGTIYNPTNGKSYRSEMSLNANGTLRVAGCVSVICQTQIWRRAN